MNQAELLNNILNDENLSHAQKVGKYLWNTNAELIPKISIKIAEQSLPAYEKLNPEDDRPRNALEKSKNNIRTREDYVIVDGSIYGASATTRSCAFASRTPFIFNPFDLFNTAIASFRSALFSVEEKDRINMEQKQIEILREAIAEIGSKG